MNDKFWRMSHYERRVFVLSAVRRKPVQRRTTQNRSCRNQSFLYSLSSENGDEFIVCKMFFLTTLGYQYDNDSIIRSAINGVDIGSVVPRPDMRGKGNSKKKIDQTIIVDHIESFNPVISHYRRKHAPRKRYLPSDLSVRLLYRDFVGKHGDVCSYEHYRRVFKSMNISIVKLGHEECEQCEDFHQHNKAHNDKSLDQNCEQCLHWSSHIGKANMACTEYRHDAEAPRSETCIIYSVDLQKIIMLPRIDEFKAAMFTRRLVAYNESFVPLGTKQDKKPMAVVWHEATSGRKKEDIISSFYAFLLHHRMAKHVVLWMDNCSSQNKNWCFLAFLVYVVNSTDIETDVIEIKYFEPGHTFMSVDSFHHQVELSLKTMGKVYDFDDFVMAVSSAQRGCVDVKEMKVNDFYTWLDWSSSSKIQKSQPRPYLSDIVHLSATRGKKSLAYKTSFSPSDENFITLDFLTLTCIKYEMPQGRQLTTARGISVSRQVGIVNSLCRLMPQEKRQFWESLPTTEQTLCGGDDDE